MSEAKREAIYCICCSTELMGYRIGDKVVWFDKRHGEKHVASVDILEEGCAKPHYDEPVKL